jgi:hypothetical protein
MFSNTLHRSVIVGLIALVATAVAGCQGKAGVFSGTVVDSAGKPVPGAQISIIGTTSRGDVTSRDVYTDNKGHYSAKMPDGAYGAKWAFAHINYDGRDARFALDANPQSLADQDISAGPVVPFVFKISGMTSAHRDPNDWGSYYGQAITMYGDTNCPDKKTIQLTLVPQGPLADGSQGKTLVMSQDHWEPFKDIPLGIYDASIKVTDPNGNVIPSRIGHWQADWGQTARVAWDLNAVAGPNGHTGAMLNLKYTCSAQ